MSSSKIEVLYIKHNQNRLCQGDIFRDISIITGAEHQADIISVQEKVLPYAVVLTQDCDLEQDYNTRINTDRENEDKFLHSILLCPAYTAQSLKDGSHLDDLGLKMQRIASENWKQLKQNNLYRYHHLKDFLDLQVPSLVVDFKHYHTVPREYIYRGEIKGQYIATISELFRENLSARFAQYLSRIGLPDL